MNLFDLTNSHKTDGVDPANIKESYRMKNVDYFFVERKVNQPCYIKMLDIDAILKLHGIVEIQLEDAVFEHTDNKNKRGQ